MIALSSNREAQFLVPLDLECLLPASCNVLRLDTHDATTPTPAVLSIVVELRLEVPSECVKLFLVLVVDACECHARRGLLVHKLSEAAFALDDAIRNFFLAAERGQPTHELNGLHIVCNDDELCNFVLDQCGDVVQTILDHLWLLGFDLLAIFLLLSHLQQAVLLRLPRLRHVLLHEAKYRRRLILVNGHVELVDRRWHLQAHEHDLLHALQADILRPFYKSTEVPLWLDVATQSVIARSLLEEGIFLHLLPLV
mmetsp:Transcript_57705/g.105427  ORF Transcript_57705/g.105427 Transcript_57705/m.105427 type:complete len:254 (-) Transcript_57705:129-890(-)